METQPGPYKMAVSSAFGFPRYVFGEGIVLRRGLGSDVHRLVFLALTSYDYYDYYYDY